MDRLAQTLQPTGDTLTELHPASSMWTCLARDIGDPGTRELRPLHHLGLGVSSTSSENGINVALGINVTHAKLWLEKLPKVMSAGSSAA